MKNTTLLDASVLLATPASRAGELFGRDPSARKSAYRKLISKWHPDHNPDPLAHEVFIHLGKLFEAIDTPSNPAVFTFRSQNGKPYAFKHQGAGDFELGSWYRGLGSVAYLTQPLYAAAHMNFYNKVHGLSYASIDMKTQLTPCLPQVHAAQEGSDGQLLVLKRDPEGICLADLIEHATNTQQPVDARHVGWILGSLHNIACYLEHQKIAHHGITPVNVWINPRLHRTELLGGWFHSLNFGETITALPAQTVKHAPRSYLDARTASNRLDLECIRGLGRTLLGDPSGMRMHPSTPSALIDALRLPAHGSAIEEYRRWQQALHASFGPPKFVKMKLSFHDVYKGE